MTRPVSLPSLFWRLFRTDFLILGGVVLLMLIFLVGNSWTSLALIRGGVEVTGEMVTVESDRRLCQRSRCGPVQEGQTYYRVARHFSFETGSGDTVTFTRMADQAEIPQLHVAQPVTITYLAQDPAHHRPGSRTVMLRELWFLGAMGGLGLAAMAGLATWRLRQAAQLLRLREGGTLRRAQIVAPPEGAKGPALRAIHWQFADGRRGHSLPQPDGAARPRPGTRVEVHDDGRNSAWPGDVSTPD